MYVIWGRQGLELEWPVYNHQSRQKSNSLSMNLVGVLCCMPVLHCGGC